MLCAFARKEKADANTKANKRVNFSFIVKMFVQIYEKLLKSFLKINRIVRNLSIFPYFATLKQI